jgi:formylmethanofuran dehydrogenase subunit E
LDEVAKLQKFLNKRVLKLLSTRSEDLFDVVDAGLRTIQTIETPAVYLSCADCGQLVLKEHAAEFWEKPYCVPCLQLLQHAKTLQSLH